ncbi:hypothetical protein BJY16_008643 [Actinoplanes octamycinicus]|uniref:Uncharacterized protein n=1 Tax=Actinoplanes octamycinicus TaxID=135948 RepID=A0A7W7H7B3_9ACTN|nr:hypothetical protein [Actinoplanes octamycinicus]MBB4745184.1 hypothetical protein [Actinoplanes octamycinicus]GIE62689.1 hypothetical protein Aoc01nite_80910 [Actinoplanes octamycinicus]
MRRIILAVTTGALLLTGTACGSKSDDTAAPAAPAATTATTSAAPAADYTADTKKTCGDLTKLLSGQSMVKFGEELGKMIGYKQAKATAQAKQARTDAGKKLKELAAEVTKSTGAAQDPELKAAGEKVAQSITTSAGDDAFFAKFKTEKDVDKALETEMTAWFTPLDTFCS